MQQSLNEAPRLSKSAVAYHRLKQALIRCELAPGQRFTERECSDMLSLGKTPVREALTQLVAEEWISPIPGHGYLVEPVTLGQIEDVFEVRLILEPAIARLAAARITEEQLTHLRDLTSTQHQMRSEEQIGELVDTNRDFHMTLAQAAGNPLAASTCKSLIERTNRIAALVIVPERAAQVAQDHAELIEALEAGDEDLVASRMTSHMEGARDVAIKNILSLPSVRSARVDVSARDSDT